MEEIENIKNELEEIKTARDNIKTALQNEGETVTDDIRTYANTIPNVNKVKTVNSVEADTNKNVQLDASKINVDDTAETKQTIKVAIETLRNDVNNISVPEYSVIETTVTEGYSKTYSLTKDGTEVGVKINIPKDLVVNKGSVKVVATVGTPYDGAVVGDKYLDIELNDPTQDHIYIPVKELVDVYTAGDGIEISANNVIKSKNSNLVNGTGANSLQLISAKSCNGGYAVALGLNVQSTGYSSFAVGTNTVSSGSESFAEGFGTKAQGDFAHAEGHGTVAGGDYSHAEGIGTLAESSYQHAQGRYNIADTTNKYAHIVGNGSVDGTTKSNAHTIDWEGNGWFAGNVKVGGTGQDDTNAKQLATQEYVDNNIITYTAGKGIEIDAQNNTISAFVPVYILDSTNANFDTDLSNLIFQDNMNEDLDKGTILVFYIDNYKFVINGKEASDVLRITSNIDYETGTYLVFDGSLTKVYIYPIETTLDTSGITSTNRYVELPYSSKDLDVYLNGEKLLCTRSENANETDNIKNNYSCYYCYDSASGKFRLYFTSDYTIESTDKLVVKQYGVEETYTKS